MVRKIPESILWLENVFADCARKDAGNPNNAWIHALEGWSMWQHSQKKLPRFFLVAQSSRFDNYSSSLTVF